MANWKIPFSLYDCLWKELGCPLLRTYCQTLENGQSGVQAGNRQDSSCPLVQKSKRAENGLACMRVHLRTGRRLSLPISFRFFVSLFFLFLPFFFCDQRGGELSPVFQSVKTVMETSELRHLISCELGIIYSANNEIV